MHGPGHNHPRVQLHGFTGLGGTGRRTSENMIIPSCVEGSPLAEGRGPDFLQGRRRSQAATGDLKTGLQRKGRSSMKQKARVLGDAKAGLKSQYHTLCANSKHLGLTVSKANMCDASRIISRSSG